MKVKNYRTFWILSILYLVSLFAATYIFSLIWDSRPKQNGMGNAIMGTPLDFPDIWHTVTWVSSWLMFIPGLLIIISFTNEYSFKTHRQNIIDGLSRLQFITVKIALAVIIALVSTIAVFLIALGFGLAVSETAPTVEKLEFVGYFFVQCLSYASVALLFSLLFKRSGIAIGVFFLYSLFIENMLAGILNKYADNIGRYLPLETTDNLIRVPVFKIIVSQLTTSYNTSLLLGMSVIYLGLYYFISIRKFQTDDL